MNNRFNFFNKYDVFNEINCKNTLIKKSCLHNYKQPKKALIINEDNVILEDSQLHLEADSLDIGKNNFCVKNINFQNSLQDETTQTGEHLKVASSLALSDNVEQTKQSILFSQRKSLDNIVLWFNLA